MENEGVIGGATGMAVAVVTNVTRCNEGEYFNLSFVSMEVKVVIMGMQEEKA